MTKAELENRKSLARALFLSGMEQLEIADKVGVSRVTISKWCTAEGWKQIRAARNVTRPELTNKILALINKLLEEFEGADNIAAPALADKLSKLTAVIDKLDKRATVVDVIEVFMNLSHWLESRAATDPGITPDFIKKINRYQNLYISELVSTKQ